jgi:predicted nucleic acid-binding protein
MRAFLDTNVFVYQFDVYTPDKQSIANKLIKQLSREKNGVCSPQVVREFTNVFMTKFQTKVGMFELDDIYDNLFAYLVVPFNEDFDFLKKSIYLHKRYDLSFYDALIVQSAIDLGCDTLYSEDLQDGQTIEGVKIVNPFAGNF